MERGFHVLCCAQRQLHFPIRVIVVEHVALLAHPYAFLPAHDDNVRGPACERVQRHAALQNRLVSCAEPGGRERLSALATSTEHACSVHCRQGAVAGWITILPATAAESAACVDRIPADIWLRLKLPLKGYVTHDYPSLSLQAGVALNLPLFDRGQVVRSAGPRSRPKAGGCWRSRCARASARRCAAPWPRATRRRPRSKASSRAAWVPRAS